MSPAPLIRSARNRPLVGPRRPGKAGKAPGPGARVQVRAGHVVTYDIKTTDADPLDSCRRDTALRPRRDTRLDVGLIKIQAGDDAG